MAARGKQHLSHAGPDSGCREPARPHDLSPGGWLVSLAECSGAPLGAGCRESLLLVGKAPDWTTLSGLEAVKLCEKHFLLCFS